MAHWHGAKGLGGFAFRLPPAMASLPNATAALLRGLRALPQIRHIEPDKVFYAQVGAKRGSGGEGQRQSLKG